MIVDVEGRSGGDGGERKRKEPKLLSQHCAWAFKLAGNVWPSNS